jgi:pilus assembly protein CpaB
MNTARIVVLTIALGAGGVAAYLAREAGDTKPVSDAPVTQQLPTVDILVAKADIGLGHSVKQEDLQWQSWPAATASNIFIRRDSKPEAIKDVIGSIARTPFIAGEPIREQKLVRADDSGFMAAILTTGMRAISTEISAETGAGRFILPNDRVHVILTRRLKNPDSNQPDVVTSEIILANIRVLAIDQAPREKDGQNAVVGKTVTLELKPEQTATLAAGRQAGTLSLALRSIGDVNMVENTSNEPALKRGQGINVVRYGVQSSAPTQK